MKHVLLWIAFVLFIAWIVARLVLAVTSLFLNLLWIIALVLLVIWALTRLR